MRKNFQTLKMSRIPIIPALHPHTYRDTQNYPIDYLSSIDYVPRISHLPGRILQLQVLSHE